MSNTNISSLDKIFSETEINSLASIFSIEKEIMCKVIFVFDEFLFSDNTNENKHRLILFHYAENFESILSKNFENVSKETMSKIEFVRGCIVSQKNMLFKIRAPSMGKTNIFNFIEEIPDKENCLNVTYKKWIFGTLVRVWRYENYIFFSTHRKISFEKSRFTPSSPTFYSMMFNDQNLFNTPEDFFRDSQMQGEGLIHMFILNNKHLIIDADVILDKNSVYYVGTLSINPLIDSNFISNCTNVYFRHLMKTVSNPILLPEFVKEEDIQNDKEMLFLQNYRSLDTRDFNNQLNQITDIDLIKKMFKKEETYIVCLNNIDSVKSCRILPLTKKIKNSLIGGLPNLGKTFCDCISLFSSGELFDKKIIIPYGFSIEELEEIIKNGFSSEEALQAFNLKKLNSTVGIYEVILTNIIFASPHELRKDALDKYNSLTHEIIKAADFLYENRGSKDGEKGIEKVIKNKDERMFDGFMNLNKTAKNYFYSHYIACFIKKNVKNDGLDATKMIIGLPKYFWKEDLRNYYNNLHSKIEEDNKYLYKCALISFIMNSPSDAFFAILSFEDKVIKTRNAFMKSSKK